MRVVFDTSVLFDVEDPKEISTTFQKLLTLIRNHGHSVLIHNLSLEDINNDKNEDRKKIILSKVRGYPVIEKRDIDSSFYNKIEKPKTSNDLIDDQILYCIYKNAADFLITLDNGILHKARILSLEDRVLSPEQAVSYLDDLHKSKEAKHTIIDHLDLSRLNLADSFFDVLKEDYGEAKFKKWFETRQRKGEKGYAYLGQNDRILALLILKDETEEVGSIPPLPKERRLKIRTLKVDLKGSKLGELFLKFAFQFCINKNLPEVYCTHFEKQNDSLVYLLEQYGFQKVAKKHYENDRYEGIWLKKFKVPLTPDPNPLEISKQYYPAYVDSEKVRKFVIPIIPEFHDRLFPEYKDRQMRISDFTHINQQGNAIKKAYLCNSNTTKVRAGDIILFYKSSTEFQKITSLGVVESAERLSTTDSIVNKVGVRTVYTYDEIERMTKPTLTILFRHHFNLPKSMGLEDLKKSGILAGAPISITHLDNEKYKKVKELSAIDERFTIN